MPVAGLLMCGLKCLFLIHFGVVLHIYILILSLCLCDFFVVAFYLFMRFILAFFYIYIYLCPFVFTGGILNSLALCL